MLSCSLKAGNLIMDAVIYSSHGSYLAPADLMVGEGREGVKVMIETEGGRDGGREGESAALAG